MEIFYPFFLFWEISAQIVILDAGLVSKMTERDRRNFRGMFTAVVEGIKKKRKRKEEGEKEEEKQERGQEDKKRKGR